MVALADLLPVVTCISRLVGLTGPWTFGLTRSAMRWSTAAQLLVAVNGRFLNR